MNRIVLILLLIVPLILYQCCNGDGIPEELYLIEKTVRETTGMPTDNNHDPSNVIHYEGRYYVWYTQHMVNPDQPYDHFAHTRIDYITSRDGLHWEFGGTAISHGEEGDLDDGPERSGEDRNQFQVVDLPEHSRIQWRHRLPDTGAWSDWKGVAGYGRTKAFILYTGGVVDGGNPGYAVLIQENGHFRCVVYHWGGKGDARGLFYPVNGGWNMPTHGKTPVPASLSFTKKKTKYCEVQWRNTDGSTCRARIRLYKEQIPRAGSRYCQVDDLGCDE